MGLWEFAHEIDEQISVQIVCEKDASDVRTVTLGRNAKVGQLKFYLWAAKGEKWGTYYVFRANGRIAQKNSHPLVRELKLKEGDSITCAKFENEPTKPEKEMAEKPKKIPKGLKRLRKEAEQPFAGFEAVA